VGLLFLDLNEFKPLNDQFGHAMGDQLLKRVASCLRGGFRGEDLVARLGGDEFVVLLPRAGNLEEVRTCALKVKQLISGCNEGFEVPIRIGASIGISLSPDHGITAGQLLSAADAAMYRAKQGEGDGIAVASNADVIHLNSRASDRMIG
jgi:diguanylate cyclase (GGDEF)-like protein